MPERECILISGAGPVGMITGLYLARQGIPVKLFDTLPEIPDDHRAATLQPSTLAMLDEIGMTSRLLKRGIKSPIFQFRDRLTSEIVAEFDLGLLSGDTPHPFVLQIEQHKTVGTAYEIARKIGGFEIHRGQEVVAVSQDEDGVDITVRLADGSEQRHRGRYLIGCDGGRSIARKSQDINFPGFTWRERFIIVATHFDFAAAGGYRYRNYVAHPTQWCALMKVPGEQDEGVWRCLFPAMTDEDDETVTSDEWIQERFAECYDFQESYNIVHRNLYVVHQRVAERFRKGRVILAGDAAHVNNPIGGMGMNSGIHDGINLAEKLGRIWRGEAGEELLDLYDRQRRPTAEKYVQAQTIQNKEILQENDPESRAKRLDSLRAIAADRAEHINYLRRVSLIAMVEEANSIT
ncbi:MAG: NAD(P)/FAD-dependent oxidoreductase [Rhodospirillales bacterium]